MRVFVLFFLLMMSGAGFAQQKFIAHQSGNVTYLEHKVAAKENWYSVGRIYFISPKEIARFNQLSMDKGLGIGQLLKIPLKDENFSQQASASTAGARVVHEIQQKEGLLKVANRYRVDKDLLKKWNGLGTDQINAGNSLTIGFLLPKVSVSVANPLPVQPVDKKVALSSVSTNASQSEFANAATSSKPIPAPPAVTVEATDKQMPNPSAAAVKVADEPVAISNETKARPQSHKATEGSLPQGHFAPLFEQQSKEGKQQKLENSVYGVFKSTSGWKDGKFYVLMNNVVPGTVVKLVMKSTRKELFAKVLGAVPPGKESEGMALRMSNATVAALGAADNGSDVDLVWYN